MPGFVPQVTCGAICSACNSTVMSNFALSAVRSCFHRSTASWNALPRGTNARPSRYANVVSSGATMPARAPPSMLMLQTVMRPSIRALSMDGRMTVCNMSIEGGARAGMVAPDDTTFAYLEGRAFVPRGKAFQEAVERWNQLRTDDSAQFDMTVELQAEQIAPQVTWGTNPGMVTSVTARVPDPREFKDPNDQKATESALKYMGLKPGTPIVDRKSVV